jgi:hypothetical protein
MIPQISTAKLMLVSAAAAVGTSVATPVAIAALQWPTVASDLQFATAVFSLITAIFGFILKRKVEVVDSKVNGHTEMLTEMMKDEASKGDIARVDAAHAEGQLQEAARRREAEIKAQEVEVAATAATVAAAAGIAVVAQKKPE